MKQESETHRVSAIIYDLVDNLPYFLILRYFNYWGFFGGGIENKETPKQTIIREVKEETGLRKFKIKGIVTNDYNYDRPDGTHVVRDVFLIKANRNDRIILEQASHLSGYAWLPYEEAVETLTHENSKTVLKKALEVISFGHTL